MSAVEPENFSDPALKGAIQRCCGGECAPAGLRSRIQKMFSEADHASVAADAGEANPIPISSASPKVFWRTNKFTRWAAAAMFFIVVGTVAWQYWSVFAPPPGDSGLPPVLAAGMVSRHDSCGKLKDHHFLKDVPKNDFPSIQKKLDNELGYPVLAEDLGDRRWTFRGAAVCPVGETQAAHLMFVHSDGRTHISVYSIPVTACYHAPGDAHYEELISNHPVAGFVQDRGLYCIVGCKSLKLDDVENFRDQLRTRMAMRRANEQRYARLNR
jgi:hypothetical protein